MARGPIAAGAPVGTVAADPRLDDARRAFEDAVATLEEARTQLLRAHVETSRLWHGIR